MENSNNSDELDKLIALKKLEIERLKLEESAYKNGIRGKYRYKNVIGINVILLFLIVGAFFLPWTDINIGASVGEYRSSANFSLSGFYYGMYTFRWPFLLIWGIAFVFAVLNQVRLLGSIAVFGVFISIWILVELNNSGIGISLGNTFAGVSFSASPIVYSPLIGFISLLFNFFVSRNNVATAVKEIGQHGDIAMYDKVETQSAKQIKKVSVDRIIDEYDEKNKNHLYNKSKLQIVTTLNFVIVLGLTYVGIINGNQSVFATAFILIISFIVLGVGVFANRILIKEDLFFRILVVTILTAIFFFIQMYRLFDIAYVYEVIPYDGLYQELLLFILTGVILYLNLVELSCIKLNYNKVKKNEVS